MPQEIEHKFLVRRQLLPKRLPRGKHLLQGFLSIKPVVRVRLIKEKGKTRAFLTIKGKGLRVRAEFEYPIPVGDARKLLKLCGRYTISKMRRQMGPIELDEFLGRHRGLWLAEIELPKRSSRLPKLPPWIGKEVTNDPRYANVNLAARRFPFRAALH
jgi:CYTH domain-containing protein